MVATGEGEREGVSTDVGALREEARWGKGCWSGGSTEAGCTGSKTCIGGAGSGTSRDDCGGGGDRECRGRGWGGGGEITLIESSLTSSRAYASKIKASTLYDSGRPERDVPSRLSLLSKRWRRGDSASLWSWSWSLVERSLEERGSGTGGGVARFEPAPRRVALKRWAPSPVWPCLRILVRAERRRI